MLLNAFFPFYTKFYLSLLDEKLPENNIHGTIFVMLVSYLFIFMRMKKCNLSLTRLALLVALMAAGGCASQAYLPAGDDLYVTHDRNEILRREQAEAEALRAQYEAARAQYEATTAALDARMAELELAQRQQDNGDSYSDGYSNPYADVLVDDYETAYARRLRGFSSPSYRMPSSYWNLRYSSRYTYLSAYDPWNYNIIVMGDESWVEPKYITAMFGTWGTPIIGFGLYSDWRWPYHGYGFYHGWGPSWSYGWGWPHYHWGWGGYYPYYWGWGGMYHPTYPGYHPHPSRPSPNYPNYRPGGTHGFVRRTSPGTPVGSGNNGYRRPGNTGNNDRYGTSTSGGNRSNTRPGVGRGNYRPGSTRNNTHNDNSGYRSETRTRDNYRSSGSTRQDGGSFRSGSSGSYRSGGGGGSYGGSSGGSTRSGGGGGSRRR